jgi:Zn ribbon nucleic-acid-binding protein
MISADTTETWSEKEMEIVNGLQCGRKYVVLMGIVVRKLGQWMNYDVEN